MAAVRETTIFRLAQSGSAITRSRRWQNALSGGDDALRNYDSCGTLGGRLWRPAGGMKISFGLRNWTHVLDPPELASYPPMDFEVYTEVG